MKAKRLGVVAAFVAPLVLVCLMTSVDARDEAHGFLEKIGVWSIISEFNAVTVQENFWMGTKSINDPHAVLSIKCFPKDRFYALGISSVDIKLPTIEKMMIFSRIENGKPISLLAASSGTGNVLVFQSPNDGSFNRFLKSVFAPKPTPKNIGISVGPSQLFFPLDGFVTAIANLSAHCGFYPDPTMGAEH